MGITPEIMAQLMSSGMDPKQLLSMAANPFGAQAAQASPQVKKNKNDPSQQKVQLINIRTFQKLDKKKELFFISYCKWTSSEIGLFLGLKL